MVKKALVLAAGFGSRLRPLTEAIPKPLLPLWNVPLIEHALLRLESWGVTDIMVNLHWKADALERYLSSRKGEAKITLSKEKEILGTGGALRPLRRQIGNDQFWLLNADIAFSVEPEPFVEAANLPGSLGAVWLEPDHGPRTVEIDYAGRITCYHSIEPGVDGNYTFCGLSLLKPEIFKYLPDKNFCTVIEAFEAAMYDNRFMRGVAVQGSYWADTGTPSSYLDAHRETKRRARKNLPGGELYAPEADRLPLDLPHFFCIGPNAKAAPDVKGSDSILIGNLRVEGNTSVTNSVLVGSDDPKHPLSIGGKRSNQLTGQIALADTQINEPALKPLLEQLGWAGETAVSCLGARGSNRTFWRLWHGENTAIAVSYSTERFENTRYAGHTRLLAECGVTVPAVLADIPESQCQAFEDWGEDSLQQRMLGNPGKALDWYPAVMALTAKLHGQVTDKVKTDGVALEPPFDRALYEWERQLFEDYLLKERFGFEDGLPADVRKELEMVAEKLMSMPQVVVHRDLQSSNILFRRKTPAMIDFQGMRMGPAVYDLASLLYDPYVEIDEAARKKLLDEYAKTGPNAPTEEELALGAVQRLIQALGAYGRLASVGQTAFTRHIAPALDRLLEVADQCGLNALGALTEELIHREEQRLRMGGV